MGSPTRSLLHHGGIGPSQISQGIREPKLPYAGFSHYREFLHCSAQGGYQFPISGVNLCIAMKVNCMTEMTVLSLSVPASYH